MRAGSAVDPVTVRDVADPFSVAADSTPVGTARLPSGLMPCWIEVKSSMPSLLVSLAFGLEPMANSMSSGKPSESESEAALGAKCGAAKTV